MVSKYSNVTPSAGAEIRRESQAQQNKSSGALTSWVSVFMAAAAGAAMANNYVMHPVLPDVADSLGVSISATGILAGASQAGYLLGIIFLVPLGDIFNLKKVIIIQQITLSMVLLLSALSPSFVMLASALFLVGLMSSSSLQISSLGFRASPAGSRGATMGAIMAGISSGIVLSRIVSGALSEQYGWRIMLATLAAMTALIAIISLKALPSWGSDERASDSYWGLIKSLPDIFIKHASLRASVVAGCCWFFVFSILWVSLSVYLANEFSLSSTGIGLFGFAGLAGVLVTRPAGALADRIGSKRVILYSFAVIILGVVSLAVGKSNLWLLGLGVVLFDMGVFAAQVANQTRVLDANPDARNRTLSVYMCFYYGAGALGSSAGSYFLSIFGWIGVCAIAGFVALFGFIFTLKCIGSRQ
jgi:predicted MFS family arabinose efflux permease